jgi:hypothetical protein
MRPKPAITYYAKRIRLVAKVLAIRETELTFAAAYPRIDDSLVPNPHALSVRPERNHAAHDLMPRCARQFHTSIRNLHDPTAPHVEGSLLEVQIRVAYAAIRNLQQDLGAARLWVGIFETLQGLPVSDD